MRPARLTAVVAVLLSFFGAVLLAQDWRGRGRLRGTVQNEKGEPIAGAQVTLLFNGRGPAPLVTDKKGNWGFLGLAGGSWKIVITAEGYNSTEGEARVAEGAIGPGETLHAILKLPQPAQRREPGVMEWLAEGNELFQQQKYAEARVLYEKALGVVGDADKVRILRVIASAYFQEGNHEEAVKTLQQVLVLAPGDVETLRSLIGIFEQQGKRAEADAYIAQLPAGEKVDPVILLNRGIELYNRQAYPEALDAFLKVVTDNPEMADAYYFRGLVYLAQNQSASAKADFEKILALDPAYSRADEIREYLKYLDPHAKQ